MMKRWWLWLIVIGLLVAFVAGCLTGSGALGLGIRSAKETTITLSPGPAGRCVSNTANKKVKAKRLDLIEWQIVSSGCSLPGGGLVQLRFVGTSPLTSERPTQMGSAIIAAVLPEAALATHAYKVWADYPGEAGDYVLEDPELEIVQFSIF